VKRQRDLSSSSSPPGAPDSLVLHHDWPEEHAECLCSHILRRLLFGLTAHRQVIDNSGALLVECVNVLKNKVRNGWGGVGDEIVCVVKRARPVSVALGQPAAAAKVRRGDVRRAVVVRTKKPVRRPDGRFIRFDDNAAVLLNNKREMLGTRIGGIVSADLRMKGWGKIVALAPKARPDSVVYGVCDGS
jgi:ribosomal protein L14